MAAVFLVPLAAQVQLQFALNFTTSHIVELPNQDTLFVGSVTASSAAFLLESAPTSHAQITLAAIGPESFAATGLPVLGGSGNDVPQAVAVDPSGNIWIVGNTNSDDFHLVNPIMSQKPPYQTAGFVLELNPTGTQLLFATYLAGPTVQPHGSATYATAIAIDSSGNTYVGGSTNQTDFPTTPGAYLAWKPGAFGSDSFGNTYFYSYAVKISPAGKLVYSTLLGTGASDCEMSDLGPSGCLGYQSTNSNVSSMIADSTGVLTVAGIYGGSFNLGSAYVIRLAADASKLEWSASPGANFAGVNQIAMAEDPSGNLDLLGRYVTAVVEPGLPNQPGTPGLFTAQLTSEGSATNYSTDLGESVDANVAGLVVDGSGNAYLAGTSSSPQFPTLAGVPDLGADFVLRLDPTGTKPVVLFRFPFGVVEEPPTLDASGRILLPGAYGSLLAIPPNYAFNSPAIVGFANAASYAMNTGLYPGEIISIFGFDLGGAGEAVQVFLDGVGATVLYAGETQINVQVPFRSVLAIASMPPLQVMLPTDLIPLGPVPAVQSLGIFTTDGVHAAALNQDGTVNSASNPAANGSIITLFGTGAVWPGGAGDGAIPTSAVPLDQEKNGFEVLDASSAPMSILYEGTSPGTIYGVFQLNVQLTPDSRPPFTLQGFYGLSSNTVQVYLK